MVDLTNNTNFTIQEKRQCENKYCDNVIANTHCQAQGSYSETTECLNFSEEKSRNNMLTILPLEKKPWIQTYQLRNYELGLLQNKQPWVFSKYINIYYDQRIFNHLMLTGRYFEKDKVMQVQKFRFNRSILSFHAINFTEWVCKLIEDGWYLYGLLDEYYIKAKPAHNKLHFRHSLLLYGIDKREELFYAIGYVKGYYEPFTITFSEFLNAFWSDFNRNVESYIETDIDKIEFDAFRLNPEYQFEFDLKEVYLGIDNYLNSTNPKKKVRKNCIFGIQCEHYFIKYILEEKVKDKPYLDPRFSRFFMEMKDLMHKRLDCLANMGYIPVDLVEEYHPLVEKQNMIHMLFLKYNLRNNDATVNTIVSTMSEIIPQETEILLKVRDELLNQLKEQEAAEYC